MDTRPHPTKGAPGVNANLTQTLTHELGRLRHDLSAVAHEIDRITNHIACLEGLLADPEQLSAEPEPHAQQPVSEPRSGPTADPSPEAEPDPEPETAAEEHPEPRPEDDPEPVAIDVDEPDKPEDAAEEPDAPGPEALEPEAPDVGSPGRPAKLPDVPPDLPEPALYTWQRQALEAWNTVGSRGVVEAVTGAGKTRVGLAALADSLTIAERRVVVMTPSTALVNQWEASIRSMFPGLKVSTDAARSPGWHVLVDTVQTLSRSNPLWPGESALLIADEAHRYGAPTFAQALRPAFTHRLGLTATYERGDEGDLLLDDRDPSYAYDDIAGIAVRR